MSELCLQGENLHLWRGERHVLRGLTLAVRSGQILQVSGANGSGKTSLLRTLSALIYPEEGRILWGGRDVREDLPAFHDAMSYIGHEPPLKADLTARENLHYWVGLRRRASAAQLAATLEQVGVPDVGDRLVRTLSAGQKRRVALAGLALLAPPLWLLDEPTTNLDTAGQQLVGRLIGAHAARGGLVVAAVHHTLSVPHEHLRHLELS
jgi:heme exporter protein A